MSPQTIVWSYTSGADLPPPQHSIQELRHRSTPGPLVHTIPKDSVQTMTKLDSKSLPKEGTIFHSTISNRNFRILINTGAQKQKPTTFLMLPLEVRIAIYKYALELKGVGITRYHLRYISREHRAHYRLPPLLRTHPQMTREMYASCTLSVLMNYQRIPEEERDWQDALIGRDFRADTHGAGVKVSRFNDDKNHKGLLLDIKIICSGCAMIGLPRCRDCKQKSWWFEGKMTRIFKLMKSLSQVL